MDRRQTISINVRILSVVLGILMPLNLFSQFFKEEIEDRVFLFEDQILLIDASFNRGMDDLLQNYYQKDDQEQYFIVSKDSSEFYFMLSKYEHSNSEKRYLLMKKGEHETSYFILKESLGYDESNFLEIAKFSLSPKAYDPNYSCIVDEFGSYLLFNSFIGGYTRDSNYKEDDLKHKPLSNRIDSYDLNTDVNLFNQKLSPFDLESISAGAIAVNGFMPLNFFCCGQGIIDSLNSQQLDFNNCFFVGKREIEPGVLNEIFCFEKVSKDEVFFRIRLFSFELYFDSINVKKITSIGSIVLDLDFSLIESDFTKKQSIDPFGITKVKR